MSELAKAGLTQIVDVADKAVEAAIVAIEATLDTAEAAAVGAITVGEESADSALAQLRTLKDTLVANLKKTTAAVADVIPTP